MKYETFLKNLAAGKTAPIYFFFGEENFLLEEAIDKILNKYVTPGTAHFNRDILYAEEVTGAQIVNIATSYPMMAEYRVVVVKNIERLNSEAREMVLRYCERPALQTRLVLTAGRIDRGKKFFNNLMKKTEWIEFRPLYENRIPMWIINFVKQKGKQITPRAVQLLQAKSGNSLRDIANEINKLIHFTRGKEIIDEKDVEMVVGVSRNYNIFELWDVIGTRNFDQAITVTRQMLEIGESPIYIVSMLTTYFVRLWKIKTLLKAGKNKNEIAELCNIHFYFISKYLQQAAAFSEKEIETNFEILLEADVNLKTSYQKPHLVMDLLMYRLLKHHIN